MSTAISKRDHIENTQGDLSEEVGLSLIVPAYNEEKGVGRTVRTFFQELAFTGGPVEVIVVDDGSTDNTPTKAETAGARVLRHNRNLGYGAALKTGLRHAKYDLICISDADGTYPQERILELVARMTDRNVDMVVGARTGDQVAIPLIRRPAKWILGCLAQFVSGQKIPDLNSGFRVFKRETALRFFNILPDGFSFTTTITLGMLTNGYLVEYEPINYHPRVGKSKIRPVRDTLNFFILVLRIALYFSPLKIFLPMSGLIVLVAVLWGILSKLLWGELADVSTLVIALGAVQVGVMGLLAELINSRLPNFFRREEDR